MSVISISTNTVERVVIRSPNYIGDHVMALRSYEAIRAKFPGAELVLAAPECILDLSYPQVFNSTVTISESHRRTLRGIEKLAKELASKQFDMAFFFLASVRGVLPFALARIAERVGFRGCGARMLLTKSVKWEGSYKGKHKSEVYFKIPRSIGCTMENVLSQSSLSKTSNTCTPNNGLKRIVVAPGASIGLREWPFYDDLIFKMLTVFPDFEIVVVGSTSDRTWGKRLDDKFGEKISNKIGETSLNELVTICQKANLVIANDSGVSHVAATIAKTTTLVLFGPGNPQYVKPEGPMVRVVRKSIPCSPCEKSYCRALYGYQACLKELSVEAVFMEVESALKL